MVVKTERFGDLEVAEEEILHFPEGILGFEHLKRYVEVAPRGQDSDVRVLQAVDDPAVGFIVVDPLTFRPDYQPRFQEDDLRVLECDDPGRLRVLTILTVPEDPRQMTANLMAPVVINVEKGLGRQVVQAESEYAIRHNVLEELARARRLLMAQQGAGPEPDGEPEPQGEPATPAAASARVSPGHRAGASPQDARLQGEGRALPAVAGHSPELERKIVGQ